MYGDWYARNMYSEGSDQYRYHLRRYGHPSIVGYRAIAEQWRAENFNPDELMELFVAAGAQYFVGQAMHHDNFFNYDSEIHSWNSVKVGPRKDITQLWREAAQRHGLPFGLSEHLGATFTWWKVNKGRDQIRTVRGASTTTAPTRTFHRSIWTTISITIRRRRSSTHASGIRPTRAGTTTGVR